MAAPAQHYRPKVLNSWKEIASYLRCGVRTVQRWEHDLGLPVRRPWGKQRSSVIAVAEDLDEWVRTRSLIKDCRDNGAAQSQPTADELRKLEELWRQVTTLQDEARLSRRAHRETLLRLKEAVAQFTAKNV
jgi:hypothetical protein